MKSHQIVAELQRFNGEDNDSMEDLFIGTIE